MFFFFFFNDTATTEIYTLSLHDALPILTGGTRSGSAQQRPPRQSADQFGRDAGSGEDHRGCTVPPCRCQPSPRRWSRSEEHTSELQSRQYLVCRLLLEKKNYCIVRSHPI